MSRLSTEKQSSKCTSTSLGVWPSTPWYRIHIDYAGPFQGHMFLVIVDSHSKWPEVVCINSTIFARNGIPVQMVSDNGLQFKSEEFSQFMKHNRILHLTSAPYHPAPNGQAERFVLTFKHALNAMKGESGSVNKKLAKFLLAYRNTPHSVTGQTPANLFMMRTLRSRLDLLKPDVAKRIYNKQLKQHGGRQTKLCELEPSQLVLARNYTSGPKWVQGTVVFRSGHLSYQANVGPHMIWRRHIDQLLATNVTDAKVGTPDQLQPLPLFNHSRNVCISDWKNEVITPVIPTRESASTEIDISPETPQKQAPKKATDQNERGYPVRTRKPPDRLDL